METRTLRATLHSGTTAAGNGTAATNPTGGGLILGTLSGSGSITASVVVEISAAGSVWVPLREPERINGAGSVPVQIYYSTTAAQVRLRVVDITGTLSVGLYAVGPEISTDLKPSPDGSISMSGPVVSPNLQTPKTPCAAWAAHPNGLADPVSGTAQAVVQINLLAPCRRWTHIQVEIENRSATAFTGLKNLIAAVSNNINAVTPVVGSDVTGDPATGWVSVETAITVPALADGTTIMSGPGRYQSSKIYLPSHYAGAPVQRDPIVCLRFWVETAGASYRWLQTADGVTPMDDRLGSWCIVKRITGQTTNAACVAGTSAASDAALQASATQGLSIISRVLFFDGANIVGESPLTSHIEVCGASTMSVPGAGTVSASPWIGYVNAALRPLGFSFGYSAYPGAKSDEYLASAKARLDTTAAHFALYPVFNGTDSGAFTAAGAKLQVTRWLEFAAYAVSKNVIPVAVLFPHDGVGVPGSAGYIIRENSAQIVLSGSHPVLDFRKVLGKPDGVNNFVAAYTSDGTHFTQAGSDKLAADAPAMILSAIRSVIPLK